MCWKIKKNHTIPWLTNTHENDIIYQLLYSPSGNQVMHLQTHQQTHPHGQQSVIFATYMDHDIDTDTDIDINWDVIFLSKATSDEIVTI